MLDPNPDVNIPRFFLFDSTAETLSLPEGKVLNVNSLCYKAIFPPTTSARQAARVLGMLQSCDVVSATTFPLPCDSTDSCLFVQPS